MMDKYQYFDKNGITFKVTETGECVVKSGEYLFRVDGIVTPVDMPHLSKEEVIAEVEKKLSKEIYLMMKKVVDNWKDWEEIMSEDYNKKYSNYKPLYDFDPTDVAGIHNFISKMEIDWGAEDINDLLGTILRHQKVLKGD